MSNFPSQAPPNEYNAVTGQTYKFQGATLEADHPPVDDSSNKVATTGWVQSLLSGTPMWPTTSDATGGTGLLITVSDGVVNNLSGGACNVNASAAPIAVNASTQEYVYVRFSDCQIVVSTSIPDASIGYVISLVTTDATRIISIVNYSSVNSFARTDSPIFTGNPQAPTPPPGDCDNSIATTEFVCQALQSMMNQIPYPTIVNKGGLNINVTDGKVPKPDNTMCEISPLPSDIGVNPNTIEYVYVRYVDCQVVASTTQPLSTVGFTLGTVSTNGTAITAINQYTSSVASWLHTAFKVGFGGKLIPV